MRVTISKGDVHNVNITGDFTGPYINLDISAQDAYNLYRRLEEKKAELYDLATNYYSCSDCGETHHKDKQKCPNLE